MFLNSTFCKKLKIKYYHTHIFHHLSHILLLTADDSPLNFGEYLRIYNQLELTDMTESES